MPPVDFIYYITEKSAGVNATGAGAGKNGVCTGLDVTSQIAINCTVFYVSVAQNGVRMEVWDNIRGGLLYQFKDDPRFPDQPDITKVRESMETNKKKSGNEYGLRLTSYYKVRMALPSSSKISR